jgi:hypothetical protein
MPDCTMLGEPSRVKARFVVGSCVYRIKVLWFVVDLFQLGADSAGCSREMEPQFSSLVILANSGEH